mmetsp:Transcript_8735/g.14152  ORF Transcript_8735/g.14152 Transcript_8735/m.14152 type:complete len:190 (+) Transcript_8735:42-611(+)
MFEVGASFREACALMNSLECEEHVVTVIRLALNDKFKDVDAQDKIPTCKELAVSRVELDSMIELCKYVMDRAKFNDCSGEKLASFLASEVCGLKKEIAALFGHARNEHSADSSQDLVSFGQTLNDLEWSLDVNLGQEKAFSKRECITTLHFGVHQGKDFSVEFSHDELLNFFYSIEKIQTQLDSRNLGT